MKKILLSLITVITMLALVMPATPALAVDADRATKTVQGTLTAVNLTAHTVTVKAAGAKALVTVKVGASTIIVRNKAAATIATLKLGDSIIAKYDPVNLNAKAIVAHTPQKTVTGVVASVNIATKTIVIKLWPSGTKLKLTENTSTAILRNKVATSLSNVQMGDWVQVKYNPMTKLANLISAASLAPKQKQIAGTVASVNPAAGTVSINAGKGGKATVLKTNASTAVLKNGAAAGVGKLKKGDKIQARFDPASKLASKVEAETGGPWDGIVVGLVSAVDTNANTVTITSWFFGDDVTLNVVENTTAITLDGNLVGLGDLQVGDKAQAKYDSSSMNASVIDAKSVAHEQEQIRGTIAAVDTDGSTITITVYWCENGQDYVLNVDGNTVITRNDNSAALGSLQVGDDVEANYDPATMLASKIDAYGEQPQPQEVYGTISAVDTGANTLTIAPSDGSDAITLVVDGNTNIKLDDNGASLGDLKVGGNVDAYYDPTTMLASEVDASSPAPTDNEIWGTITNVDTNANTVTVTTWGCDQSQDYVLTVDSTTVILHNEYPSTMTDLQIGDNVDALYTIATMHAITIDARTPDQLKAK